MNSLLINSDQANKVKSSIVRKLYAYIRICVCVRQGTGAASGAICPTQPYVLADLHVRQHRCKDLKFL